MRRGDPNFAGNHRKNMVQSLEASLSRLGTDYVDLYRVHAWGDFLGQDSIKDLVYGQTEDLIDAHRRMG